MQKLIWLSDLHFVAEGRVQGHDPRVRLSRAVDWINRHHPDAAYCVISGDMVDRATAQDYGALSKVLAPLAMPCLPMVGNHDDRVLLAKHLAVPGGGMTDFIQYAVPLGDDLLICLDTLTPGADSGSLCAARLEWLRDVLEAHKGARINVFMHHPPLDLGLPMQDQDKLSDGAALLDLLAGYSNIGHLFCGHVHRPICGRVRGMPFATLRSVLYQAPPPWPAWDWESFAPAPEDPELGVITLGPEGIVTQFVAFCDYADGVTVSGQSPSG